MIVGGASLEPPDRMRSAPGPRRPMGRFPPIEPAPPGLAVRIAAAQVLADTLSHGGSLDERISSATASGALAALDGRDRALVRAIVTAALRRLGTIRKALVQFLEKGVPRKSGSLEWILVPPLTQILFLETPDHAE